MLHFSLSLTFARLEQREAELGDPERADEVDVDLLLDVAPRLPVELAAHAHPRVVDQGVQTWNGNGEKRLDEKIFQKFDLRNEISIFRTTSHRVLVIVSLRQPFLFPAQLLFVRQGDRLT